MTTITKLLKLSLAAFAFIAATLNSAQAGITYYVNDHTGSPVAALNEAGQVVWREKYRPYGERLVNPAGAKDNAVWFTSRRQDAESGLVYMGARYYDPVVGRFMSTDPKGFDEGNVHSHNRYAYGNNNPYRFRDATGRAPTPLDLALAGIDAIRLVYAAATGGDVAEVAVDLGISAGALALPLPGAALIIKAERAASAAVKVERSVEAARELSILAKDGTEITGLTTHGVNRVIGDGSKRAGTRPEAILDAVRDPAKITEGVDALGRPFKVYTGESARVVVNPESGKIISTNPMSREGAHLP